MRIPAFANYFLRTTLSGRFYGTHLVSSRVSRTAAANKMAAKEHSAVRSLKAVADYRVSYSRGNLQESDVGNDPLNLFRQWFDEADNSSEKEVNAMCLSTVDANGRPSARMVLLKGFDERGFVWYTNYESKKAKDIDSNPYAALTFWWPSLERSVRIEGVVMRVAEEESDKYFGSRPPLSRIGAWASDQSRPVQSDGVLQGKLSELKEEYLDEDGNLKKEIERPPFWGGFRLNPDRIEFWTGRPARLHDRIVYSRKEVGDSWSRQRLQP